MTDGRPDYLVRAAKEIGHNVKWTDIGVAYKGGGGCITVLLTALPLNDKVLLIPVKREELE